MSDARQDELRAKAKYPCAYCGAPMYHRGSLQPSISYAECWECWAKNIVASRDKWRTQANRWQAAAFITAALWLISGWVILEWTT